MHITDKIDFCTFPNWFYIFTFYPFLNELFPFHATRKMIPGLAGEMKRTTHLSIVLFDLYLLNLVKNTHITNSCRGIQDTI